MTITCVQTWREFPQHLRHMLNATEENRQNAGRVGTFQVGRGVPNHPHSVIRGNSRAVQGHEGIAIAFDNGRPGIDQRVVPIEQDGAWPGKPVRQAHVTLSPADAKRTYPSRNRRAVGPGLPSPTFSPSILTTGVTNEVALVMNASFAFFASAKLKGRSTNLSCRSPAIFFKVPRVMPARMPLSVCRVTSSLSGVTI